MNGQRYLQNQAQNCIFRNSMGPSWAIQGLYLNVLTLRNFIAEFHRENVSLLVKQRNSVSKPPFGGLSGSSLARWKARTRLPIGYH